MMNDLRVRHTHPVLIVVVVACFAVILATQGLVVRKASDAATDAQETARIADAVTNPDCDPAIPACRRQLEQRAAQATLIPDINEVATIAAFCGNQHTTLDEVRACVEREFRARTGRDTNVGPRE